MGSSTGGQHEVSFFLLVCVYVEGVLVSAQQLKDMA